MDPIRNPFTPGAGSQPPELAGRDELIERAAIAIDRVAAGRHTRNLVLHGVRGVGKTVLLGRIRTDAEARGIETVRIEAPEDRPLAVTLSGPLRAALLRLDRMAAGKATVRRALKALAGFMRLRLVCHAIELEITPEAGLADSGDLELDLADLLCAAGEAARDRGTALLLCMDEMQYVHEHEMAALIAALHATAQANLPVALLGAGLPTLAGRMGRARSYAERLFEFHEIGRLDDGAARNAITLPIEREGEEIERDAVDLIVEATEGYPYYLQQFGKYAWDLAFCSPISRQDMENARVMAIAELDSSFFRVRFDRLTPTEKGYLRAMAAGGRSPQRSHEIAARLGRLAPQVAPVRNNLIRKGMIYSPGHGDTAFTVPMFDSFMRRMMPDNAGSR